MKNIKILIKSLKEIKKLEKRMIPCTILIGTLNSVIPFINIFLVYRIIFRLEHNSNIKLVLLFISLILLFNLFLKFLQYHFNNMFFLYQGQMYDREQEKIGRKLYLIDYIILEDHSFKELIHMHNDSQKRYYSAFFQIAGMLKEFISGFITITISIIVLFPLLKIGFTKTGNSFFQKPIFLISIILGLIISIIFVLMIVLNMNKKHFKTSYKYAKIDKLFNYYLNMFSDGKAGKTIRIYKEQDFIISKSINVMLKDGKNIIKNNSIFTAISSSIIAIISTIIGFGVYLFIAVKGHYGEYGVSSLVLYCSSFLQIVNGIIGITKTFGRTEEICPLADYYFKILNTENQMKYGSKELNEEINSIVFKNVSFKYPNNDYYTLKDLNLTINPKEHIALVGKNGSGKTTFIKLLCRLYDVTEGEILINGINIKSFSKESLCKIYSIVFQDYQVFALPLFQNVTVSSRYNNKLLEKCLSIADIKNKVDSLPNKEQSKLCKINDDDGINLSGGETQKIVFARALYKDSPVFVLDEPTAALDPMSEHNIYNSFNKHLFDKILIFISHRLSSCIFCDQIIVFNGSKIEEKGTHMELLAKNGLYKKMWNSQAINYFKEDEKNGQKNLTI